MPIKENPALLHRYFTVLGSDSDAPAVLRGYLYEHAEIVEAERVTSDYGQTRYHYLVRVSAPVNVDYLADYQARRIASGPFGVSDVFDNTTHAIERHIERTGYKFEVTV